MRLLQQQVVARRPAAVSTVPGFAEAVQRKVYFGSMFSVKPGLFSARSVTSGQGDKPVLLPSCRPCYVIHCSAAEVAAAGTCLRRDALRWAFVEKRAQHKASWRRRWLVLSPTALGYYNDALDMVPLGIILLSDVANVATVLPSGSLPPPADISVLPFPFYVETASRNYVFSAADELEQAAWVSSIVLAKAGKAAEAAALGAMGETLWGGNAQLLPPLVWKGAR